MNEIITTVAGAVDVVGKTNADRRLSVLDVAGVASTMALSASNGKVGKAARMLTSATGLESIASQASHNNYRPVAEYIAGRTGKASCVSNRASFVSLPDRFDEAVREARMGKNGGYVTDKKTGAQKPGAKLALALELKAVAVELVQRADELYKARMEAKNAAQEGVTKYDLTCAELTGFAGVEA